MAQEANSIWGTPNSEDFSPSATLIHFDPPLPLLRGPLLAGKSDDPSMGPFVLAFRDADSWRSAYRDTESKMFAQCLAGARVGCSISASKKCSTPWWKTLFGSAAVDFAERERCEEREMSLCVAASKEPCVKFAKEKCLPAFRDARISCVSFKGFSIFDERSLLQMNSEVTNYRGSILLEEPSTENLCNGES